MLQVDWNLYICSARLGTPQHRLGYTSLPWWRCFLWDEPIKIIKELKYFSHIHKTKNPSSITGMWLHSVIPHPKSCQKTTILTWKLWPLGVFPPCQILPWSAESYFYPAVYNMICGCLSFHRHLDSNNLYLQIHLVICSYICTGRTDFFKVVNKLWGLSLPSESRLIKTHIICK